MFPTSFALKVVKDYTNKGDAVLDPFGGRGTSVFAAAISGRKGIGIEINPVGWVYTQAKLHPARKGAVLARIEELAENAWRYQSAAERLPVFFRRCYCPQVLRYLSIARRWLNWEASVVDRTLMALLLVHLHGKRTDSFSNQMRQTKSMSPPYALRWWKDHDSKPPKIDPVDFLSKKLRWRYAKGLPKVQSSRVYLADSTRKLGYLSRTLPSLGVRSVKLLFTSPPYCGVTNYHYDQWLRLWLLGGPEGPAAQSEANRGKFVDRVKYKQLLEDVFEGAASSLARNAVVYVRTDSRDVTLETTIEVLKQVFPKKMMKRTKRPFSGPTQTGLFGGESADGEIDIVLR
jgi:hypothetical protein